MDTHDPLASILIVWILTFVLLGIAVWFALGVGVWTRKARNNMQDFITPAERIGPIHRGNKQWH